MNCIHSSQSLPTIVIFPNETSSYGRKMQISLTVQETFRRIEETLGVTITSLCSRHGSTVTELNQFVDGDLYYCVPESATAAGVSQPVSVQQLRRSSEWLTLNVGGRRFTTTRNTLTTKDADSMLARMFACSDEEGGVLGVGGSTWQSTRDENGAYLIDRSPTYFEPILNYLRVGELIVDHNVNMHGVLAEAKFYGISSLVEMLESRIQEEEPPSDTAPITRRAFVDKIIATPPDWELRCQGLNFEGTNLSKLDLRHINFKYAILRRANLSVANLSFCNFERADMSGARLDGANLLGVKMMCVNLEGASMRGCNLEDPAGTRANMEGANMKHVDLEGSHMASANLRVATLKNANLQNCDLRGAVLAGADLENCDLSGCDLQEANLRGANLRDAAFELMVNPVHMSQAVR